MRILSKNTVVLQSSLQFTEDKSKVVFQVNTDLYVEGNPYSDLVTTVTIFNLECPTNDITNIVDVAQEQINVYISQKYPPVEVLTT